MQFCNMADLTGTSSNTTDALFESLSEWEYQLKRSDFPSLEMEP